MKSTKNSKIHNLSLQGSTGIIVGIISLLFIFGLKFILQSYTSGTEGFSLLPISFFQILVNSIIILYIIILYVVISTINKKRRKKLRLKGWSSHAKFIRKIILLFLLIFGILAYYFTNTGELNYIIPTAIILAGIIAIIVNSKANGNTLILGLFFIVFSILSWFYNELEFTFLKIAYGILPIIYSIYYIKK